MISYRTLVFGTESSYHSLGNLAENDVLAIQPGGNNSGDEELGSVGYTKFSCQCYYPRFVVEILLLAPALAMLPKVRNARMKPR